MQIHGLGDLLFNLGDEAREDLGTALQLHVLGTIANGNYTLTLTFWMIQYSLVFHRSSHFIAFGTSMKWESFLKRNTPKTATFQTKPWCKKAITINTAKWEVSTQFKDELSAESFI